MAHNAPSFFAADYFAPDYWGGATSGLVAALYGSSAMTAVLSAVETAYAGSSIYYRSRRLPLTLTRPVFITATMAGGGRLKAQARASGHIAAATSGLAALSGYVGAAANMAATAHGGGALVAMGNAPDIYAAARFEDEFWLLAA